MVGVRGRELGMKECRLFSPEQKCSLIIRTTGELQFLNGRADCQHIARLLELFTGWKEGALVVDDAIYRLWFAGGWNPS